MFYQSGFQSVLGNGPLSKSVGPSGCVINHPVLGFDDHCVYVRHGQYKGKIGRVRQLGGGVARVHFESAFRGSSIQFIQANYLLA